MLWAVRLVIWQALKALREAADKVKQPEGKSQPPKPLASATATAAPASEASTPEEAAASKEDEEQSQVMLALGALLSSEPAAAVQVTVLGELTCATMALRESCQKAGSPTRYNPQLALHLLCPSRPTLPTPSP